MKISNFKSKSQDFIIRKSTLMRAYLEDKQKIKNLALELSSKQGERISEPEALRRALKTANKDILLTDAEIKKRWRNV